MNKVLKLSLCLLISSIYACPATTVVNPPSATPLNDMIYSTTPPNNNSTSTASSGENNSNYLKPFSRPQGGNPVPATSLPSTSPTTSPTTIPTQPSGDTGTTPDVRERATFNGKIYDLNGQPIEGAIVNAVSTDPGVNWTGESQVTVGGAYVFRNAPIGARITITVTKEGWGTRTRSEVLRSNLQGDPTANVFDFSGSTGLYNTSFLKINLFDANGIEINNATIKVESLNSGIIFSKTYNTYPFIVNDIPAGTQLKITVNANDKQKERVITSRAATETLEVNFGGMVAEDKPFAIASIREEQLDSSINKFINTSVEKFSTFSVDTDTASYTLMRNSILNAGSFPSRDSVRIEEYVNYFDYNYEKPENAKFSINTEIAPSPFDKTNTKHILRIGIQGQEIKTQNRKDSIITFLIDTSGSMGEDNKLNLVKNSLKVMLKQLKPTDKVAIVEYNFIAKTVLKHTLVRDESKIVEAIDSLKPISSTDIEKGLRTAFREAQESYDPDYLNRIILCSDGINSTVVTNPEEMIKQIRKEYETNVSVSAIGVGFKNYNDTFLETIASKNDGYYSYIDNIKEAVRLFVESATDKLQVIAKDAKIQVEFNPVNVKNYRLIGYDNKVIANQDFRNDNVDSGEIGSGHSVTALYEIELSTNFDGRIGDVYMRYKDIVNNLPLETTKEIKSTEVRSNYNLSSESFKKAVTVSLFGEILRRSYWSFDNSFTDVKNSLKNISKDDKFNEFMSIVEKSETIKGLEK